MSADDRSKPGRRSIDELLAVALAGGATYTEAAAAVGCSERTVRRRAAEDEFRAKVAAERAQLLDTARGWMAGATLRAARSLDQLATGAQSEAVRAHAAGKLLDLTVGRRGVGALDVHDLRNIVKEVIGFAVMRLPDDEQSGFMREVEALFAR